MTSSIILGTSAELNHVCEIIKKAGFDGQLSDTRTLKHNSVDKLVLQIHGSNNYMPSLPDIKTNMEFDDHSERFPENPDAMEVLRKMNELFPDMLYCEYYADVTNPPPIYPLSELVD